MTPVPPGVTALLDPARGALEDGLAELKLDLSSDCQKRLLDYLELLTRWNRSFNLTGTRAPGEIVTRHLLDSLSVIPHLRGQRVLDAGTGAGLPGLVLAIARPELHFTLLDSALKKTRFCIQAAAELALNNVSVIRERIDAYQPERRFSSLISRAFQSAPELMASAARLLEPGGLILIMKGVYPESELGEVSAAGYDARVTPVTVPGLAAKRHLLLVEAP